MPVAKSRKQVSLRVGDPLYTALQTIALREHQSVAEMARLLIEDGLRLRTEAAIHGDDTPSILIAEMAAAGGSFAWLDSEPDIYDDNCGDPA